MCEICSKLTIKTPELLQRRGSDVFAFNFEQIFYIVLVFPFDFKQINGGWVILTCLLRMSLIQSVIKSITIKKTNSKCFYLELSI